MNPFAYDQGSLYRHCRQRGAQEGLMSSSFGATFRMENYDTVLVTILERGRKCMTYQSSPNGGEEVREEEVDKWSVTMARSGTDLQIIWARSKLNTENIIIMIDWRVSDSLNSCIRNPWAPTPVITQASGVMGISKFGFCPAEQVQG